ncbi:hypothetical protein Y1Q_0010511 [Alligator mississippiensis]|uniref:Uncharacterized protein n=1 Tax=Alligator mississippiensis TaxID=8496 RepID=A0A151NDQ1_ALLMI|nr:hypothetical protein Y1Q_0010511 [Alligator mississippiensis]
MSDLAPCPVKVLPKGLVTSLSCELRSREVVERRGILKDRQRPGEDDVDFYIADLEPRDLDRLWFYDGSCLFAEETSLDVDWGVFEVGVTVHRRVEEGELLWDMAELGSEEAESSEVCELFTDLDYLEDKSSKEQEGEEQALPSIRHQGLDEEDSLQRPATKLAWASEGKSTTWKGSFLQQ